MYRGLGDFVASGCRRPSRGSALGGNPHVMPDVGGASAQDVERPYKRREDKLRDERRPTINSNMPRTATKRLEDIAKILPPLVILTLSKSPDLVASLHRSCH
ncbi:hypothetical protein E1B28_007600 [Marasmius oreades]|uniref:Uncharacterized protein n=1 Tax=Marasmius oreades TaxID=181124 RepID=A0A9P7S2M8_9AGAR|nr:uncharacterized protein E1B28_007600 [Marasmius oreades]KAG7093970.1 hypothetical protein E1B28_007600 [Marasmius oreades]